MRARAVFLGGLLTGVACLVGAVALWCEPAEVGWFAYAGSSNEASPRVFLLTARREFALVLAALGLLLLGSVCGFAVGRRGRSDDVEWRARSGMRVRFLGGVTPSGRVLCESLLWRV